jgi:hypothetical protein
MFENDLVTMSTNADEDKNNVLTDSFKELNIDLNID